MEIVRQVYNLVRTTEIGVLNVRLPEEGYKSGTKL